MPGSGKKSRKKEPPVHEKKGPLPAEVWADDRAMGQQGMASAASVRASYGQSTICNHRTKAEIYAEFRAQNKLETDNTKAQHNRQIYRKYDKEHKLRRKERLSVFWRGQALSRGHRCYSLTKNQLEVAK